MIISDRLSRVIIDLYDIQKTPESNPGFCYLSLCQVLNVKASVLDVGGRDGLDTCPFFFGAFQVEKIIVIDLS